MNNAEAKSLIELNLLSIRDGVTKELCRDLEITGPFEHLDFNTFVVHVSLNSYHGAIVDSVVIAPQEIRSNLKPADLLEAKGCAVGVSMAEVIGRSGARVLRWDRTRYVSPQAGLIERWRTRLRGRWQRLQWAWKGHIPIRRVIHDAV